MKNLFSFAFLSIVFAAVSQSQPAPNALQVEVMIFSGRPNPVFTVTDPAEIREIMTLAANLPRPPALSASANARLSDQPPILGYRGLQIINSSAFAPGVQAVTVRHASVELHRQSPLSGKTAGASASLSAAAVSEVRTDKGAALESKLLEIAGRRNLVDPAILEEVRQDK